MAHPDQEDQDITILNDIPEQVHESSYDPNQLGEFLVGRGDENHPASYHALNYAYRDLKSRYNALQDSANKAFREVQQLRSNQNAVNGSMYLEPNSLNIPSLRLSPQSSLYGDTRPRSPRRRILGSTPVTPTEDVRYESMEDRFANNSYGDDLSIRKDDSRSMLQYDNSKLQSELEVMKNQCAKLEQRLVKMEHDQLEPALRQLQDEREKNNQLHQSLKSLERRAKHGVDSSRGHMLSKKSDDLYRQIVSHLDFNASRTAPDGDSDEEDSLATEELHYILVLLQSTMEELQTLKQYVSDQNEVIQFLTRNVKHSNRSSNGQGMDQPNGPYVLVSTGVGARPKQKNTPVSSFPIECQDTTAKERQDKSKTYLNQGLANMEAKPMPEQERLLDRDKGKTYSENDREVDLIMQATQDKQKDNSLNNSLNSELPVRPPRRSPRRNLGTKFDLVVTEPSEAKPVRDDHEAYGVSEQMGRVSNSSLGMESGEYRIRGDPALTRSDSLEHLRDDNNSPAPTFKGFVAYSSQPDPPSNSQRRVLGGRRNIDIERNDTGRSATSPHTNLSSNINLNQPPADKYEMSDLSRVSAEVLNNDPLASTKTVPERNVFHGENTGLSLGRYSPPGDWRCPACDQSFDMPIEEFQQHVLDCTGIDYNSDVEEGTLHIPTNIDRICPMCSAVFPEETPQSEFELHVNKHFEDDGHPLNFEVIG